MKYSLVQSNMACNPALMVDPLGLQAQPLLHYAYGNNHTIVPPGYMMNGQYVYLSADRLNKAKNNFASYSLKAETESFILKSQILNSILEGLGEGASIHNKGEGNYKFWFNAIGYNSGESGEWQNDGGKAHEWKGAGFTVMLQSLMMNVSEKNGTVYGSGVEFGMGGVGQLGFGESLVPIWGSGRTAVDDFQNGRLGSGIFNSVMAVSDVFLVKSLFTAVGKVAFKSTLSFEQKLFNKGILGFTEHGSEQMLKRGFSEESILKIINEGSVMEVIHKGRPQIHYRLGEYGIATPIGGLNNGKIISVYGDYNVIRFSDGMRGIFTGF